MRGDEFFAQVASCPPFDRLHPHVAEFFRDYLQSERVTRFGDQYVLSTHFPPYPSPAFDRLAEPFARAGTRSRAGVHSVTLGVTNRCMYHCWHCYNAGRSQHDLPLAALRDLAAQLQEQGCVMVALSGGEPLLREDLEEIAGAFDERTCVTLNTTGFSLTLQRAQALRERGVFALGVSLDTVDAQLHDRLRGHGGAFDTAIEALRLADAAGMYPYVVAVATHQLLAPEIFWGFVESVASTPAREIHLLEPCPTGRLAGHPDAVLSSRERQAILDYQRRIAGREDLPALSSFAHLESAEAFGCGAGLTHLYVDGSGEVCPCNLVPLSFGNVSREPLDAILRRMHKHFQRPRTRCVAHVLAPHIPGSARLPTPPEVSDRLCAEHLRQDHPVPLVFQIQTEQPRVGPEQLEQAYDHVHASYAEYWLSQAQRPVAELVGCLDLSGRRHIVEAGCGTGAGTVLLAERMDPQAELTAVDLSAGMLREARSRLGTDPRVHFLQGDALKYLERATDVDLVFTSWVLGYIPLEPFLAAASRSLTPGGQVAVLVHRAGSPREPLEIFAEIVAQDPAVLRRSMDFDFPADAAHLRDLMVRAGLQVEKSAEGHIDFRYARPARVLEHLLKSGAGTAFYQALDPARRPHLERRFLEELERRHPGASVWTVTHEYVTVIARRS